MFMFRAKIPSELATCPDILEACRAAVNAADNGSDFISIPHDIFCECPDESVDYAVMEKPPTWWSVSMPTGATSARSALEVSPKTGRVTSSAATRGCTTAKLHPATRSWWRPSAWRTVIVSTKDAVLVMNRERSQDVKKAVEFLKQNQRSEYKRHREIYRPGPLRRGGQTPRFNVNRITVKPGGAFSMQMHHRAEHWSFSPAPAVTVNGKQFLLTENQSTFIPIGAEHSSKTRAVFR